MDRALPLVVSALTGFALAKVAGRKGAPGRRAGALARINPDFQPWPELKEGKLEVCDLDLCRVYFMSDANYPCWLVLVPRIDGVVEITDLTEDEQRLLWEEVTKVTKAVQASFKVDKMNIASIGNVVAQLHVHITGRLKVDPTWPRPCYGGVPPIPISEEDAMPVVNDLQRALLRPSS